MGLSVEKTRWSGWDDCCRISNGMVDLIVTTAIGPRVMRYGFVGGQNLFKVYEKQAGLSGEEKWQLRGGHRIWVGPEDWKLTYAPDNVPVESLETHADGVTATSRVEPETGLRKRIRVKLAESGTDVEVVHGIQNNLPFAIQYAPWAVSMFPESGTGVTGFPPRVPHAERLTPSNPLVMWSFTDMRDKRWGFLEKYLVLHQDPAVKPHTKLGHFNTDTWGAYFLNGEMFFKRYAATAPGTYPDMGCSFEVFACSGMLELETLGPISTVQPGEWVEHIEHWSLIRGVVVSEWTDDELDLVLNPVLNRSFKAAGLSEGNNL